MIEVESAAELETALVEPDLGNVVVQGIDLGPFEADLRKSVVEGMTLIGCIIEPDLLVHLVEQRAIVFPRLGDRPFDTCRRGLYSVDDLYGGFDPSDISTYETTLDARVYAHWIRTGRVTGANVVETLARRLHDHSITDALADFVEGRQIVAVMGGHGIERTDPQFATVATISRQLARNGLTMASGGGPGAMEATHLGAWLSNYDDSTLATAITMLAEAPTFQPSDRWLAAAFTVRQRFPRRSCDDHRSLSIPTWQYGHEPPNAFATDIAKYFANSVREDGLLTVATRGIVFTPGSAGTVQEVFQDATQNHYETVGDPSPMVFLGVDFWTREVPVLDVLRSVGAGRRWLDLVTVTDDHAEIVETIISSPHR
ncbi:MAG: hypothetical protein GY708_12240 [Actinomycetia bacterium]|nr:hypothetical protein [Actinomycetes bacterium]MCP4958351.1 hypothetical protein [Actinomycetes bacterium]